MKPIVRPELRFRRLWLLAGLVFAALIALVCLLPGSKLPQVGLSDKIKHGIAFAGLALWFGGVIVRRELVAVALAVVAFGGLIEIAQGLMGLGREAEWGDLGADALGAAMGLLLALTPLGHWARWLERLLQVRPA